MPVVRFVAPDGALLAQVEAVAGDTLLDLARFHEVPLHWRCGQGTCGTCRLHVRHRRQPCSAPLQPKERNVLTRAGLAGDDDDCDTPVRWRLACHALVGDDDLVVEVPPR